MSEANADLLRAVADAFNAREWNRAGELMSDDVEFEDVAAGVILRGADGFVSYAQSWAGAFPDMRIETLAVFADETFVAGEFRGSGTHQGTLPTPAGDIPPTGRRFEERFVFFCDAADGKLTAIRDYYNAMSMMTQLGLMPEPAASPS
jgi:steroid delta-isomerase-like uncharacterized protein